MKNSLTTLPFLLACGLASTSLGAESLNTVNLALTDRKTGILPVMEDSASSLSVHETTGWKPVVHDRLEAYPPTKSTVLAESPAPIQPAVAKVPALGTAASRRPVGSMMAVDFKALVSKADLDFKVPLGDLNNERGLPIGNGRVGTLVWTHPEQSKLHLQVNHTDVFAFRNSTAAIRDKNGHMYYCNGCGLVDIDFGGNVFAGASLSNHLGVYDAVADVAGSGVRTRSLAWHSKDVIAIEVIDERSEPKPITVDLRMLRQPVDVSGPHTATSALAASGADIELSQAFREKADRPLLPDMNFFTALRARVLGRAAVVSKPNDQTIRLTAPAGKGSLVVLIALGQSKEDTFDTVKAAAKKDLDAAAAAGFAGLLEQNQKYWHDFWAKSFVSMTGSPVVDEMSKLYTWSIYVAGISMRGNFPAKFNDMIFVKDGDKREWAQNFWWYNQSCQHGWEFSANHGELLEPVLRWNWRNFDAYANSALRSWNSRGWYIPETSCWDGPEILPEGVHKPQGQRQPMMSLMGGGWTTRNTYNMAKFTALYYRKYLYTLDEKWLKEQVYPVARATAEFYCGLKAGCQYAGGDDNGPDGKVILKKEADGKYHLYGTEVHEHVYWGKDIIEDLAGIRGAFPLAIALSKKYNVDADKRAEWQEVLDNLAPYPRSEMAGAVGGLGAGTWAQALPPHGNVRDNMADESPRMGPVRGDFDVLTLESPDTKEWAVAMATLDNHPGTVKGLQYGCGYYPILPALMGRPDLFEKVLPLQMAKVPMTKGCHLPRAECSTMQGQGIFLQAVNAALLLSIAPSPVEKPIIRVMAGWPRTWDVSFQLQAKGGFLVSSEMKGGTIRFVEIISQLGGECLIRNPWPGAETTVFVGTRKLLASKESLLKIPTEKGRTYLLVSPVCWSAKAAANAAAPPALGQLEKLKTIVP